MSTREEEKEVACYQKKTQCNTYVMTRTKSQPSRIVSPPVGRSELKLEMEISPCNLMTCVTCFKLAHLFKYRMTFGDRLVE